MTLINYLVLAPARSVSGMLIWGFGYWCFIAMNPVGDYERLLINCLSISALAGPIVTANVLMLLLRDMYQNGLKGFGWISPFENGGAGSSAQSERPEMAGPELAGLKIERSRLCIGLVAVLKGNDSSRAA